MCICPQRRSNEVCGLWVRRPFKVVLIDVDEVIKFGFTVVVM